jgi:hypothetical protein
MTMHEERLNAAILDMWYGNRRTWYDNECPYEMNVQLSNPAYLDHEELSEIEEFGQPYGGQSWREGVALGIELGMYDER